MSRLAVDRIDAFYGKSHILHDVSLEIPSGNVVTLLGRNGAGKTTTIRSISGLLKPASGAIRLDDEDITGLRADQVARRGVCSVTESRDVFTHLTVRENLAIASRKNSAWPMARVLDDFPLIRPLLDRSGGALSGGEQQIVAIARALMLDPKILLLDEPSQGLAPIMVDRVLEVLADLKRAGLAMLVVEQKLDLALALAEHAYILENGRVVYHSSAAELAADSAVIHRHLGVGS
ncbi:ABC transporter ATP-binding protein [Rhodoligotrophos defluvii]|uniref:ABC transporter ATP-binding protein n=1 Tax=Rhodoligotrophos defluvii TaxID=2561934 RepID=UPI0010C936D4|nr:ABC transporter ATP-binding protein [Rhodoligotrophos defluvii]